MTSFKAEWLGVFVAAWIAIVGVPQSALGSDDPYQDGMRAFAAERYTEAIRHFEMALSRRPNHIGYAYMLAMSLSRGGKAAASVPHFETVIRISKDEDLVAKAYINMLRTLVDVEDYARAESYATSAFEKLPPNSEVLNQLGRARLNSGNYDGAIKVLSEATQLDTGNWTIYNNLGLAYLHSGNLKGAQLAFERAAQLNDKQVFVFNNLGMVYERLHLYDKAANAFQKALALDPHYSKAQLAIRRLQKLKAGSSQQNYTIESTDRPAGDGN